jgi:hypothetical protein
MAGLVPAIHVFVSLQRKQDVDARHKAGHDEGSDTPHSIFLASSGSMIGMPSRIG